MANNAKGEVSALHKEGRDQVGAVYREDIAAMKTMRLKAGFTLVEMLVVISIIVVLMAILFPVFQSVREKSRQANCQANLHQIAAALKIYRTDHGRYPPAPFYSTTAKRYIGGISALYPDAISDKNLMICPADRRIDGIEKEAKDRLYSSYNGWVEAPTSADEDSWHFKQGTFHSAPSTTATAPPAPRSPPPPAHSAGCKTARNAGSAPAKKHTRAPETGPARSTGRHN